MEFAVIDCVKPAVKDLLNAGSKDSLESQHLSLACESNLKKRMCRWSAAALTRLCDGSQAGKCNRDLQKNENMKY